MDETVSVIMTLIEGGGIIAVLVLFITGRLIPTSISEKHTERVLREASARTDKLADELSGKIETAVHRGVVSGFLEVNGKKKEEEKEV